MFHNDNKKRITLVILLISFFFAKPVFSAQVTIPVSDKIKAQAEFIKGEAGKPAALVLHGYLSTNNFHTVKSITSSLADEGYTVLAPTLSLNINLRKSSLKCESIHTHTLENDIAEIFKWVDWLEKQGHDKIVLVGHSSGSQELLAAAAAHPRKSLHGLYLTSLFYLNGPELGVSQTELDTAKNLIGTNHVQKYSFLFCSNNYLATAESFLSYNKLTRNKILNNLKSVQEKGIKTIVAMGSADKRYRKVGENWLDELKATGVEMTVIEGANHFFSDEHEFDLQEKIIESFSEHFD